MYQFSKSVSKYAVVCFLLVFTVSMSGAAPKEVKKSFDVKKGGTLTLDLQTGASIEVTAWDKDVVEIIYHIGGRDADLVEVEIEQRSNGVEVYSSYSQKQNNVRTDEEIVAKVPANYNLDFNTMGGSVKLKGLDGKMEGTTMGGALNLSDLKGHLSLVTMGGGITLSDSKVDGKVKTMGGEVLVENVEGNVKASSMGGKVTQRNVRNSSADGVGEEVNISTMGGDIDVDDAPNGASVKTMGGDIEVNKVQKFLSAETMGGEIKVRSADAKIKCKTMGGDIYVKFDGDGNADDRDIKLTSMSGDVELLIPADFSMDIEVKIKADEDDVDDYDIINDFGLSSEIKDDDGWHGRDTKVIYAAKTVNGGKNKVRIHTVNGNVRIKKI
ncbi:MAG: hypothetical protein SCALA702_18650 [Melioribacteraceae bacterium]|nr:MAG: hypothetical protein SCALA702_18650 [Melioribacteraceae bacterium]